MDEPRASLRVSDGRITTVYAVRSDAEVCVRAGDVVSPGAPLARSSHAPVVVALAAELHRTAEAEQRVVERLTDTTVQANTHLGSRRSGLVSRSVHAPVTGTVLGAPASGAIGILPTEERAAILARFGGIVSEAAPPRMTVITATKRLTAAITCAASPPARLLLPGSPRSPSALIAESPDARTRATAALVGHIATPRMLAAAMQSSPPLLIIGAVGEETAWHLLSPTAPASEAPRAASDVLVLAGIGDTATGEAAAALLAPFAGMPVLTNGRTGVLSIVLDHPPEPGAAPEDARDGVFRDPARWDVACTVNGGPFLWTFDTGIRTPARRVSSGIAVQEIVPAATLALDENRDE